MLLAIVLALSCASAGKMSGAQGLKKRLSFTEGDDDGDDDIKPIGCVNTEGDDDDDDYDIKASICNGA